MLDLHRVKFYLKISRPIIWFNIVPYYLLPLGGRLDLLATWRFWLGLLYFTFPVSIMMFGINDMADTDVDKYNPLGHLPSPVTQIGGENILRSLPGDITYRNYQPGDDLSLIVDLKSVGQKVGWVVTLVVLKIRVSFTPVFTVVGIVQMIVPGKHLSAQDRNAICGDSDPEKFTFLAGRQLVVLPCAASPAALGHPKETSDISTS
ncbi:hypothetical protein FOZ60_016196 [Perkinsus olseni]|uniref:Uncharacterized protein n=1 Tax=Perkinsus olseni TaxID=32597 RepID=A0A7J6P4P2_PEROL|nr:hypothetical protein FOZ60_016196 [Perkinsus olseni]